MLCCCAEVLRAAAAAEARTGAPLHIVAVWLAALAWLEDARWRKLRSGGAPTESLEVCKFPAASLCMAGLASGHEVHQFKCTL